VEKHSVDSLGRVATALYDDDAFVVDCMYLTLSGQPYSSKKSMG